ALTVGPHARQPLLVLLARKLRVGDQEACDRDRRLMVVLLEEHPLQHLRPLVRVVRDEARALTEVPEDRTRLGERPAVVEDERRHAMRGAQSVEERARVAAVDDVDLAQLERQPEVRAEQTHLVTVARDRAVVEKHCPTIARTRERAASRPCSSCARSRRRRASATPGAWRAAT